METYRRSDEKGNTYSMMKGTQDWQKNKLLNISQQRGDVINEVGEFINA